MFHQKHLLFNVTVYFAQFIPFTDLFAHFDQPVLLAHADVLYTFFVLMTSGPLPHPHFHVEMVREAKYWEFEQAPKAR